MRRRLSMFNFTVWLCDRKGDKLRKKINKGLRFLRQNGIIAQMKSDWWYDSPECTFDSSEYTIEP